MFECIHVCFEWMKSYQVIQLDPIYTLYWEFELVTRFSQFTAYRDSWRYNTTLSILNNALIETIFKTEKGINLYEQIERKMYDPIDTCKFIYECGI